MRDEPQEFGSAKPVDNSAALSGEIANFVGMFDSYEMPQPDEIAGLSDAGLVDAMTMATLMESAAIEVRLAALEEMCMRQTPVPARPTPAALRGPSRRRKRRSRKRKRRR